MIQVNEVTKEQHVAKRRGSEDTVDLVATVASRSCIIAKYSFKMSILIKK